MTVDDADTIMYPLTRMMHNRLLNECILLVCLIVAETIFSISFYFVAVLLFYKTIRLFIILNPERKSQLRAIFL